MLGTYNKSSNNASTSEIAPLIMIVDDRPDNADLLAMMLEHQGYRTIKYYDSLHAREEVELGLVKPDFFLLDVMMPGMNGFDLTRCIRSNPRLPYIPIVLLTAMQDDKARATGLEAGADDFLNKPVNRLELAARVRSLIRIKQTNDELRRKTEENRRLNDELRFKNAQMARELGVILKQSQSS
ncbi:MAG: response regulator [Chloroflexota bacterium]|nr:response regulator [Chloroflexota bacterium]